MKRLVLRQIEEIPAKRVTKGNINFGTKKKPDIAYGIIYEFDKEPSKDVLENILKQHPDKKKVKISKDDLI